MTAQVIPLVERSVVRTMVAALAQHDPDLAGHALAVGRLTHRAVLERNWRDSDVADAVEAAVLHDVGKVLVPLEILNKPAALNESEWLVVREHPVDGARQIRGHRPLGRIGEAVLYHHERWDGAGYPHGLVGEQIPAISRIVAACDAYCAMRGPRPYADAVDRATALNELWSGVGTQFDLDAVAAVERVVTGTGTPPLEGDLDLDLARVPGGGPVW
jgi:HD-GYP domain-containing protein (c-di-GMP phosphodiesterase class II)